MGWMGGRGPRYPNLNFPHPPQNKYYLVDAGYPMDIWVHTRYHLGDFRRTSSTIPMLDVLEKNVLIIYIHHVE